MTGIAFLGAGALFREKHLVQGAGSAAAIWAAGALGIVCGMGFLWLAALLSGVLVILFFAGRHSTNAFDARTNNNTDRLHPFSTQPARASLKANVCPSPFISVVAGP